jgi:hypothetical protein
MDAEVSPLLLGWSLTGFGVIAWFVWRRRKVGPMTRGVVVGYAALLGASAAAVASVLSSTIAIGAPVGLIVGIVAFVILSRP